MKAKRKTTDASIALQLRVNWYNLAWSRYPGSHLKVVNGMISGVWMLGNNYRGSGYYGSYPPQYLARMASLFPERVPTMHLFSGSLPRGDYVRVDVHGKGDVKTDAHFLSSRWPKPRFMRIYADPPYSKEHAKRYNYPMPDRRKVLVECWKVLKPGGFVIWLDTVWPMVRKDRLALVGVIPILRSQNHIVRCAFIMKKSN